MTAADWISDRRALIDAATEGPWTLEEDWAYIAHGSDSVIHGYYEGDCPACATEIIDDASVALSGEDAALIADSRTSLPKALDALEEVLELHRPVCSKHGDGWPCDRRHPSCAAYCETCLMAAPCPTVAAIMTALGVES